MTKGIYVYRRNKSIANVILVGSAIAMLVAIFYLERMYPHSRSVQAVSYIIEAVLVASVADCIAILALTTPIFGLGFTGLIQNKRQELIGGFVSACESRLIPKKKILENARAYDVVAALKVYFGDKSLREASPVIGKAIANFVKNERKMLSRVIAKNIVEYIGSIKADAVVRKVEKAAKESGCLCAIVEYLFEKIDKEVGRDSFERDIENKLRAAAKESTGRNPLRFLKRKLAETTNILNYKDMASSIAIAVREILRTIKEARSDDKRWASIEEFISDLLHELSRNKPFVDAIEAWKSEAITEDDLSPIVTSFLDVIAEWLEDGRLTGAEINRSLKFAFIDEEANDINVSEWLTKLFLNGLHALEKNDKLIKKEVEKLIEAFIEKEYHSVLVVIHEIISRLSDHGLVEKVNEVAGGNMQWLRISGAYVGLFVGGVLYFVVTYPVYLLPAFTLVVLAVVFIKNLRNNLVVYSSAG